ncbi:MAG: hypothetical protein EZS28_001280 [Streblomastix strix]|uniref:Uncharacterized protein n=1 Tax=Streblomastix strix TaxID=222440 RepID=A0A5J4X9J3_9EUKA|nr:MAG: hypothetical protein EZS28_001280 [Streblomastix strix]
MLISLFLAVALAYGVAVPNDSGVLDYYVQGYTTAEQGNCGSLGTPCASIARAISIANPNNYTRFIHVAPPVLPQTIYTEPSVQIKDQVIIIQGSRQIDVTIIGSSGRTQAVYEISTGSLSLETLRLYAEDHSIAPMLSLTSSGHIAVTDVLVFPYIGDIRYPIIDATFGSVTLTRVVFQLLVLNNYPVIKIGQQATGLAVSGSTFQSISRTDGSGGSISAQLGQSGIVNLKDSIFNNSRTIIGGGALEISTDDIPRAKSVIIDNCQFIGCNSQLGGAIYFSGTFNYFLLQTSSFDSNTASVAGNDIYWGTPSGHNQIINPQGTAGSQIRSCFSTSKPQRVVVKGYETYNYDTYVFPSSSDNSTEIGGGSSDPDGKIQDEINNGEISGTPSSVVLDANVYSITQKVISKSELSIIGAGIDKTTLQGIETQGQSLFILEKTDDLLKRGVLRLQTLKLKRVQKMSYGFILVHGGQLVILRVNIVPQNPSTDVFSSPHIKIYGGGDEDPKYPKQYIYSDADINSLEVKDTFFSDSAAVRLEGPGNTLHIASSQFKNLKDTIGKAAALEIEAYVHSSAYIETTTFEDCTTDVTDKNGSGAVSVEFKQEQFTSNQEDLINGPVTFYACDFANNEGNIAGAIIVLGHASNSLRIQFCSFKNNTGRGIGRDRGNDVYFTTTAFKNYVVDADRAEEDLIFLTSKTTSREPQIMVYNTNDQLYRNIMRDFFTHLTVGYNGDDEEVVEGRGSPERPLLSIKRALNLTEGQQHIARTVDFLPGTYTANEQISLEDRIITFDGLDKNRVVLRGDINPSTDISLISVRNNSQVKIKRLTINKFKGQDSNGPLIRVDFMNSTFEAEDVNFVKSVEIGDDYIQKSPLILGREAKWIKLDRVSFEATQYSDPSASAVYVRGSVIKLEIIDSIFTDQTHSGETNNGAALQVGFTTFGTGDPVPGENELSVLRSDFSHSPEQPIYSQTNADDYTCGWNNKGPSVSIRGGKATLAGAYFTNLPNGALYIEGSDVTIEPETLFDGNYAHYQEGDKHPHLGRNIICRNSGLSASPKSFQEEGQILNSFWIDRDASCNIGGSIRNEKSFLFQPIVTGTGTVIDKKLHTLTIRISGIHFDKCNDLVGINANPIGYEIVEDRYQNDNAKASLTGIHSIKELPGGAIWENGSVIVLTVDYKELDTSRTWVARLTYGAKEDTEVNSTNYGTTVGYYVFGKNPLDDDVEWRGGLNTVGIVLISVFSAIALILLIILAIFGFIWVARANKKEVEKKAEDQEKIQQRYSSVDSQYSVTHNGGRTIEMQSKTSSQKRADEVSRNDDITLNDATNQEEEGETFETDRDKLRGEGQTTDLEEGSPEPRTREAGDKSLRSGPSGQERKSTSSKSSESNTSTSGSTKGKQGETSDTSGSIPSSSSDDEKTSGTSSTDSSSSTSGTKSSSASTSSSSDSSDSSSEDDSKTSKKGKSGKKGSKADGKRSGSKSKNSKTSKRSSSSKGSKEEEETQDLTQIKKNLDGNDSVQHQKRSASKKSSTSATKKKDSTRSGSKGSKDSKKVKDAKRSGSKKSNKKKDEDSSSSDTDDSDSDSTSKDKSSKKVSHTSRKDDDDSSSSDSNSSSDEDKKGKTKKSKGKKKGKDSESSDTSSDSDSSSSGSHQPSDTPGTSKESSTTNTDDTKDKKSKGSSRTDTNTTESSTSASKKS